MLTAHQTFLSQPLSLISYARDMWSGSYDPERLPIFVIASASL